MTIVCGIDFSESSAAAAHAAAAIAKRLELPLELVHAIDIPDAELKAGLRGTYEPLQIRLATEADRLRAEFAIETEPLLDAGPADERLVAIASALDARLLVVGPLGTRKQHRWLLGSVAERVAQASNVPVLVVRNGASIEDWVDGNITLHVMVGVEPTPGSQTALRWAEGLRDIGPCRLVIAQIVWPADTHQGAGISEPMPLDHLRPEVAAALLQALQEWAGVLPDPANTSFVVEPGWGRVDSHLTRLAAESKMDLLVVGTHQRAGVARLWQGSVSRNVLHGASMNVACVPPRKQGNRRRPSASRADPALDSRLATSALSRSR